MFHNIYKQDNHTCHGFTLFKLGTFRAELWYCPAGFQIIEHTHENENIELMYLFGKCVFYRRDLRGNNVTESITTGCKYFLRRFSVKYYHSHSFSVGKLPLIFINFQHFLNGKQSTSASIDFQVI